MTSIDDLIGHDYGNDGNNPDKEEEQQTASDLGDGKDRKKSNRGEKNKGTQGQTKEQIKQQDEIEKKKNKNIVYLQKYYSARDGLLAEAVLIGDKPYFLISRAANPSRIEIAASVEPSEIETLRPPQHTQYAT